MRHPPTLLAMPSPPAAQGTLPTTPCAQSFAYVAERMTNGVVVISPD